MTLAVAASTGVTPKKAKPVVGSIISRSIAPYPAVGFLRPTFNSMSSVSFCALLSVDILSLKMDIFSSTGQGRFDFDDEDE